MPAPPSSLIDPAIGHLVELAAGAAGGQPGLLGVLARVADPRHRRGVRHRLALILGLALCAVVAGAHSFTAIAEWAADADEQTLRMLGASGRVPSESTTANPPRCSLACGYGPSVTVPSVATTLAFWLSARRRKPTRLHPGPPGPPRALPRPRREPGPGAVRQKLSPQIAVKQACLMAPGA